MANRQCRECCRDITEEQYQNYNGYCKNCYKDKENIENRRYDYNNTTEKKQTYAEEETNGIAHAIKIIAVLSAIAGVILGIISFEELEGMAVAIIVGSIISAIFICGFAEIIQLLQDIKNKLKG